jgi:septum formation protein
MLGVEFDAAPAGVSELSEGDPGGVVLENAVRKARAAAVPGRPVLGVDTEVALDGAVLGKPGDAAAARAHLVRLSGRRHEVLSGVALLDGGVERTAVARTEVTFRRLDRGLLDWYLATGEWHERAGAYAIQGRGAVLVERIEGDYWNVVGLPVALLVEMAPALMVPAAGRDSGTRNPEIR